MVDIASPWEDRTIIDDPYPFYRTLRESAPVWRLPGTRTFYVAPWALVADAIARPDDFSSNLTAVLITGPDGHATEFDMTPLGAAINVLATGDEPDHGPARKLVAPHFTAGHLAQLENGLGSVMERLWSDCVARAKENDGCVEWMSLVGDRLPMTLVARVIGLPDDDVEQIIALSYESADLLNGLLTMAQMGPLAEAAGAQSAYLLGQLEQAMDDPRDDLLGAYAPRVQSGDMTAEDVIGALTILVGAGGESTAGLIGNSARMLAERPALQDELRAAPELVPRFLEEVLRLESPFKGHYRHVRHDTELGGVPLEGGDHLFLLWSAANRDPLEHDDADELRLDRKYASYHLAFGRGLHFCLGAPLARLEARCAIEALLGGTTSFRLDPDTPPAWQPSVFVRRHAELHLQLEIA